MRPRNPVWSSRRAMEHDWMLGWDAATAAASLEHQSACTLGAHTQRWRDCTDMGIRSGEVDVRIRRLTLTHTYTPPVFPAVSSPRQNDRLLQGISKHSVNHFTPIPVAAIITPIPSTHHFYPKPQYHHFYIKPQYPPFYLKSLYRLFLPESPVSAVFIPNPRIQHFYPKS